MKTLSKVKLYIPATDNESIKTNLFCGCECIVDMQSGDIIESDCYLNINNIIKAVETKVCSATSISRFSSIPNSGLSKIYPCYKVYSSDFPDPIFVKKDSLDAVLDSNEVIE